MNGREFEIFQKEMANKNQDILDGMFRTVVDGMFLDGTMGVDEWLQKTEIQFQRSLQKRKEINELKLYIR